MPQRTSYGRCKLVFATFLEINLSDSFFFSRFRAFGPLRYARITLDPATGRSRGTGFACFWNLEDADKAVQQSDILRAETTGHSTVVSLHLSLFSSFLN
jgi:nucleolar protein 4